jgi:hypothetical protein
MSSGVTMILAFLSLLAPLAPSIFADTTIQVPSSFFHSTLSSFAASSPPLSNGNSAKEEEHCRDDATVNTQMASEMANACMG